MPRACSPPAQIAARTTPARALDQIRHRRGGPRHEPQRGVPPRGVISSASRPRRPAHCPGRAAAARSHPRPARHTATARPGAGTTAPSRATIPAARACSAPVSARHWLISASTGARPPIPAYTESRPHPARQAIHRRTPPPAATDPHRPGPGPEPTPRPPHPAPSRPRLPPPAGYGATTCLRAALVFAFLAAVGAGLVATLPAPTALRLLPLLAVPVARARSGCSSSPPRWQTMPHKIRSRCSHSRPCCTLFTTASVRPQAWTPARTSGSAQPSRPAGIAPGPRRTATPHAT